MEQVSTGDHRLDQWRLDLYRLHDLTVPDYARSEAVWISPQLWIGFLSACVLFDPPRDRLETFRDTPPSKMARLQREQGPGAFDAHGVREILDPDRYANAIHATYEDTFDVLDHYVRLRHGIDLRRLRDHVAAAFPEIGERLRANVQSIPRELMIAVDAGTTKEDVTAALAFLQRERFPSRSGGREERDPLVEVQCAIWKDEYRLSVAEIADRLGWGKSADDYGKPRRSTRVNDHIKGGRVRLKKPV